MYVLIYILCQGGGLKKNSLIHILFVCVSRVKKCSFYGKFDVFCFLETPVLIFALLPYYRRLISEKYVAVLFAMRLYCKDLRDKQTSLSI